MAILCCRRDRLAYRYQAAAPEQNVTTLQDLDEFGDSDDIEAQQQDTKLEIYSSLPTRGAKSWF